MKEDKEIQSSKPAELSLITDLRQIIEQARGHVAATANYALSIMYWQIGKRINTEVLDNKRAEYGKQIVASVARQLREEYGSKGFDEKNIRRMMQFAQEFPDEQIVATLMRQLSWTHILALIPIDDPLKREFYAEMCKVEHWSVRTLRGRINAMMYERTAIAKKPEVVIKKALAALRREKKMSRDLALIWRSAIRISLTSSDCTASIRRRTSRRRWSPT